MSFAPEKKFIRWILSHLTIIILLSLALYFFWNRADVELSDISSLENTLLETTQGENSSNETLTVDLAQTTDVNNSPEGTNPTTTSTILSNVDSSSEPPEANNFSKRMEHYKQTLPAEEQKVMDNAEELFLNKDISNKEPQIKEIQTNDIQQQGVEYSADSSPVALQDSLKYPSDLVLEDDIVPENVNTPLNDDVVTQVVTDPTPIINSVPTEKTQPNHSEQVVEAKPKRWQQKIHDRQKQLQSEMVMLIPLENLNQSQKKRKIKNKQQQQQQQQSIKLIKPVINTPEQRILLNDARKAFDRKEYAQAEVAYKQIIKELPELPDVVGELANVYKAQNRNTDYLATLTQFVYRLVNHNRFDEAWHVFKMTDAIDKTIAGQQRNIIMEKQAQ
ncbi:MAG: tetratricopeptide repeat protein [Gammaproteobacteria bacterium]|nr:tetratricopeptide repeat protein [Gammaproteobacteria bacterium]